MSKLIATQGIQGSGKSTWAKEYLKTHPGTYRVNGDELRVMAYNTKFTPKLEDGIRIMQEASIRALLTQGFNVVVDNMNLSHSAIDRLERIAEETCSQLEWAKFNTDIDECIRRDSLRASAVGRAVIENAALRNDLIPWYDYRPLVILDLDGTLFDCEWRRKLYLDGPKKDWGNFLRRCGEDGPNEGVLKWVLQLQKDYDIVVVSGRNERYFDMSESAWKNIGVKPKRAFFRGDGERRHDWEVKSAILEHIPKDRILFVIDDRPTVVQMWRDNGVKVYPLGGWVGGEG